MFQQPHIKLTEQARSDIPSLGDYAATSITQPAQQFGSMSSNRGKSGTLDEPVWETVKRDILIIGNKILITTRGTGDYKLILHQWDLWGPLLISLLTAGLAAAATNAESEEAFTGVFVALWVGPLVITVNANLMGNKIPIIQSLCLIIYCSSPLLVLSFATFLLSLVFRSFFLNLCLASFALVFIIRANRAFFKSLEMKGDRQWLTVYPVMLFYLYECLFVAMV